MNTKISKHLAAEGINQQNLRAFNHNLKQCRKGEVQGTYMCWAKSRSQHARFTLQIHPTFAAKKHSQELNTSGFWPTTINPPSPSHFSITGKSQIHHLIGSRARLARPGAGIPIARQWL
jgi:hypothetical protein